MSENDFFFSFGGDDLATSDLSFGFNSDDDDWFGDLLLPSDADNPADNIDAAQPLEQVADEELGAMGRLIKAEKKRRREMLRLATDTDFYFCVVFQSKAQRDKFLTESDWLKHADDTRMFLNGVRCAKEIGIEIELIDLPLREGYGLRGQLKKLEVLP